MDPVGMDDQQREVIAKEALGESFASAEARYAYERARRLRVVLRLGGGLVFLVLFGFAMYRLGGGGRGAAGEDAVEDGGSQLHGSGPLNLEPVGSPQAKVRVLAVVPTGSGCHAGIIQFLTEMVSRHPDRLRAEFVSMSGYGNEKLRAKIGMECAAVLVNEEATFELDVDGEKRKVSLIGTEPTHYTLGDVGEVITAVYRGVYGEPESPLYQVTAEQAPGKASSTQNTGAPSPSASPYPDNGEKPAEEIPLPGFRELKPMP
ncbi:MAG: hypothetical protein JXR77_19430 [Lentisphaeria bacterium]|nr:hypothetical protein [Lentisphaeria bacterium]